MGKESPGVPSWEIAVNERQELLLHMHRNRPVLGMGCEGGYGGTLAASATCAGAGTMGRQDLRSCLGNSLAGEVLHPWVLRSWLTGRSWSVAPEVENGGCR